MKGTTLPPASRPAASTITLTAPELCVAVRLLGRGRTLAQALDAIQAQRDYLAQRQLELTPTTPEPRR